MSEFIFRMPEGTPEMTYEGLSAYMDSQPEVPYANGGYFTEIGSTVTLTAMNPRGGPRIDVRLYGLLIASIYANQVEFPVHKDAHMATGEWLGKIVRDNGIGTSVGRIRRQKADPLIPGPRGYCGPLAINWSRDTLVEGHTYPVDHNRIAARRDRAERWDAEMAFRRAHPDAWDADLQATVPGGGMPDYRLGQPERAIEWAIRQEAAQAQRIENMRQVTS